MATLNVSDAPETTTMDVDNEVEQDTSELHGVAATKAITAASRGEDMLSVYEEAVQTGDLGTTLKLWRDGVAANRVGAIRDNLADSDPDFVADEMKNLSLNINENGHAGIATESVRTMPAASTADPDKVEEEALNTMVRNALTKYDIEDSAMEATATFMGAMIPERRSYLLDDVLDDLGFENNTLDTIGNDTDEILRFRELYRTLPDKDKARLLKSTVAAIDKHGDNPLINADLTHALFAENWEGERFNDFFNVLDATVVFDIAAIGAVATKTAVRGANILNTTKRLRDAETAAKVVREAAKNPEAAKKMGVKVADVVDAQDITAPDSARELLHGIPDSQAGEIKYLMDLQDELINSVVRDLPREGVIDANERLHVMAKVKEKLKKQDNIVSRSVRIREVDDATYEVKYKTTKYNAKGEEIGQREAVEETHFFRTDDVNPILKADEQHVDKFLALDPNARTRGQLRNYFVSMVERLNPQQSRLTGAIDTAVNQAYKGLKAKNEAKVNEALLLGAKYKNSKGEVIGRVWSYDELVNRGVGPNRLKLSPKEARAYIGHRNILDQMYVLENARFTENLGARGISIVDLPKGGALPAKVFETPEGAYKVFLETGELYDVSKAGTKPSPHISVQGKGLRYWSGKGGLIKLDSFQDMRKPEWEAMMEDAYAKGYVLAKNDNAQSLFPHGDTYTQWAFVKRDAASSPLGKKLLRRKKGYIPKQRSNGFFFVKVPKKGVLSGSKNFTVESTEAWSDNYADALEYAKKMSDETGLEYKVLRDHELSPEQMMYESNSTQGGMYSGARKSSEVPFIGKNGEGEFANSMEALQGYVNHIGKQYPINLVRLGLEKRAIETAKQLGVNARHLDDLISKSHMKHVSEKTRKVLREMHDQVAFLRNIPTEAEIHMSQQILKAGEAMEGSLIGKIPGLNKIPKLFYNVGGKGIQPPDYIRGITFNTLLGMYNPAQVLVQASGMLATFAIDPLKFTKSIPRAVGFATLDQIENPYHLKQAMSWFKKQGLDDYVADYELWRKTGLRENVINSNADYTSVFIKQVPYDANVLQKALANHTVFYKMGELANTRMAFSTAVEWYKKTKGVSHIDPNDADALKQIFTRSEMYRLNMSRANQSTLNKGWKAIPFQFQQVISKYYEKLLPQVLGGTDELTKLEKMRLFGVVTGMTGMVGVPLAESVFLSTLDLAGINPEDLDEETAIAFKYGALGIMLDVGNTNVDISTRASLGIDAWKLVAENIREGHDILEFVGGPTHGVTKRALKQVQFLKNAFNVYTDIEEETTSWQDLKVGASMVVEAVSDFVTVARNVKEYHAYMFADNPAFYRNGQYILDFQTMNEQTAFVAMLGFQPRELSEMYDINKTIQREQGSGAGRKPFFELDAKVMLRIINTNILGANSEQEARIGAQMVRSIMMNRPTKEAIEVFDRMNDLSLEKKFDQSNLYYKYIQEIADGVNHGYGVISATMSKQRELRNK